MSLEAETLSVRPVERNLTRSVIDRFIDLKQATPRQYLISTFHDPNAINRSFRNGLFTDIGTQTYAPTVLGFELCADADVLLRARKETETVLRALQNLAGNGTLQTNYTAEQLATEAGKISEDSTNDFRTGMFLAAEFPVFGSYSRKPDDCGLTGFSISDQLFTVKDLDHAWDRLVSSRRYFIDQARSPERRRAFLSNLYRLAGRKQTPIDSRRWYQAATGAGFQHDEIDELLEDCAKEGVIVRDMKTDHMMLSNAGFAEARKQSRASALVQVLQESDLLSRRVFVVHGHDGAAKLAVSAFLEKLDLDPIILHEQPNKGRMIIEKFEQNADVAFAVVLLTPDDFGGSVSNRKKQNLRARQNVVFEFGYFIGRLGRKHVCALMSGKIEKPSDLDGVLYIPFEANAGWQLQLGRELQAAGIDVDLNKIIGNRKRRKRN